MIIVLVIRMLFIFTRKLKITQRNNEKKRDYTLFRLLNRNIATEAAMIIPYPTKLHMSGICLRNKNPRTVEKIICE